MSEPCTTFDLLKQAHSRARLNLDRDDRARDFWSAHVGLTFDMSGGAKGAKRPLGRALDGGVSRHLGAAGTSPYLDMTDTRAALSGCPPALTTAATSLKYWAPTSGDMTIKARAVSENGFEKA